MGTVSAFLLHRVLIMEMSVLQILQHNTNVSILIILLGLSDTSLSHFPKYTHLIREIELIIISSPCLGLIYEYSLMRV